MFGKALKLFKIFGFSVKVDASWLVILVLVVWSLAGGVFPYEYPHLGWGTYVAMGVIGAFALFLSIIVHELCHSLVARRYGLAMKGITLFIFGGVAEMTEEPPTPKAEFWMAIAGPVSSFVIAGIFYGASFATRAAGGTGAVLGVLVWIGYINLLLAIFNMIPGFPLDGGRVMRSILWHFKHSLRRATQLAARVGSVFGLLLIVLGIADIIFGGALAGVWWILIGWFVRSAARQEYQSVLFREVLHGQPVSQFMNPQPVTVGPHSSLQSLVDDYFYRYHFKTFPVVEDGTLLGCIGIPQVQRVPQDQWPRREVSEISSPCTEDNTISRSQDAMDAMTKMNRTRNSKLMVVDDGRLVGLVSMRDLLQFVNFRLQLEAGGRLEDSLGHA